MPEVALVLERPGQDSWRDVIGWHISPDGSLTSFCGLGGDVLSKGYSSDSKEDKLCKVCTAAATLAAQALAKQAAAAEAIIEALRMDVQSIYSHGPVPKAIGKLSEAAWELMEEARHRALQQVMAPAPARRRRA